MPAYGLFGVAEEVADFEGLFDLFEERLNAPAAAVKIANAAGSPIKIVGYKNHHHDLALDLHFGFDAAQALGILLADGRDCKSDLVIAQDGTTGSAQAFAADRQTW